jgi:hypothetical protein
MSTDNHYFLEFAITCIRNALPSIVQDEGRGSGGHSSISFSFNSLIFSGVLVSIFIHLFELKSAIFSSFKSLNKPSNEMPSLPYKIKSKFCDFLKAETVFYPTF